MRPPAPAPQRTARDVRPHDVRRPRFQLRRGGGRARRGCPISGRAPPPRSPRRRGWEQAGRRGRRPAPRASTGWSDVTGGPLAAASSAFAGPFPLTTLPAGTSFPLVIQLGRGRGQFTIPAVTACTSSTVGNFNLPRNKGEGDIPFTAI